MSQEPCYQSTSDWAYDLYQSKSLWLRRSLFLICTLLVLLVLSLAANLSLIPLKEKVPFLYAFDHATGEVTHIGTLEPTELSSQWEVSRYFLMHYVMNYESYDFDNIEIPYQNVWAQSAEHVQKQYESLVKSDNANSPYKLF